MFFTMECARRAQPGVHGEHGQTQLQAEYHGNVDTRESTDSAQQCEHHNLMNKCVNAVFAHADWRVVRWRVCAHMRSVQRTDDVPARRTGKTITVCHARSPEVSPIAPRSCLCISHMRIVMLEVERCHHGAPRSTNSARCLLSLCCDQLSASCCNAPVLRSSVAHDLFHSVCAHG